MQSGQVLKAPSTAPAGGAVQVTVQAGVHEVWVDAPGAPYRKQRVPRSGRVTIAVPNAPGEVIAVSVVRGAVVQTVLISIVAPAP